jgi:hypothetical protein
MEVMTIQDDQADDQDETINDPQDILQEEDQETTSTETPDIPNGILASNAPESSSS